MTNSHLRESLKKQASELSDYLPVIRDRVEDIIDEKNLDYIDGMIDKTYWMEDLLKNFLEVLEDQIEISHDDLVVISYDLDMINNFVEFIDDTSIFITKEGKKK